jgi:hypothetical protein
VQSLSSWYLAKPLNELIAADGNIRAFTLTGTQAQSSTGFGFVVRHGASGNYHYARVVVLGGSGGILKGTSPNRYVDMEISYQDTPNLPFAKPVGAMYNPPYLPSVILN